MRVLFATLGILLVLTSQCICNYMGSRHYTRDHQTHLLDVGHTWLPFESLSHTESFFCALVPILILLIDTYPAMLHNQRLHAQILCVYTLRAFVCVMTILPAAPEEMSREVHGVHEIQIHEVHEVHEENTPLSLASFFWNSVVNGVHDKIWSGHMSLTYLIARHAMISQHSCLLPVACILAEILLLLLLRLHYTVDVVLAMVICELLMNTRLFRHIKRS